MARKKASKTPTTRKATRKKAPAARKPAPAKRATKPASTAAKPDPSAVDRLSSLQAAQRMGIPVQTLRLRRMKGTSPPYTTDAAGRIWYKSEDVEAHVAPAEAYIRFESEAPAKLPEPDPVRGGKLTKHNLGICEAYARAGGDLEGALDYLGVSRSELDTRVLEDLTRSLARWRADSRYLVRRATISNALTSKQMSDRQQADKILTEADTLGGWDEVAENAAVRIEALIAKLGDRVNKPRRKMH